MTPIRDDRPKTPRWTLRVIAFPAQFIRWVLAFIAEGEENEAKYEAELRKRAKKEKTTVSRLLLR